MKKIIITEEATMNAEGKRSNKNCKPVIDLKRGKKYASVADAAEKNHMAPPQMSYYCSKAYWNKIKLNGKLDANREYFCLVADMPKYYEIITMHINNMYPDYLAGEAKRKEEERFLEEQRKEQARLAKERKLIEKAKAEYSQACAKYDKAMETKERARAELLALGVTEI